MKCACVCTGPKKEVAFSFDSGWDPKDSNYPSYYYQSRYHFERDKYEADQIYVDELPEKAIRLIEWEQTQWKVYGTMVFVFQRLAPCIVIDGNIGIKLGSFDYVDHFESLFLLKMEDTFHVLYDQKTGKFGEGIIPDWMGYNKCKINEKTGQIVEDKWSTVIYDNFTIYQRGSSFQIQHTKPNGFVVRTERPRILEDWNPFYGDIWHMRGSYIHIGNHKYDINSSLKRSIMLLRDLPNELKKMLFDYLVLLIY